MARIVLSKHVREGATPLTAKDLYDKLGKFISIGKGNLPIELDFDPASPPGATTVMMSGKGIRIDNLRR